MGANDELRDLLCQERRDGVQRSKPAHTHRSGPVAVEHFQCPYCEPVWINVNWLLADVLPRDHTEATLELVARSGMREYFDPHTGEGLGAECFAWTAALALDLIAREA